MSLASMFTHGEEARKLWGSEERSHRISAQPMISRWRVSAEISALDSLRRAQAELGLLFKSGHTSRPPQSISSAQELIDSASSLSDLCERLGISWAVRLAPEFDGSIGHLGRSSWGLIIEGEEGNTQECLAYTQNADLICIETLPQLTRPQIISATASLEALKKEEGL